MHRILIAALLLGTWHHAASAQFPDCPPGDGLPPGVVVAASPTSDRLNGPLTRLHDRLVDRIDRRPCCGYGKDFSDFGCGGYRKDARFIFGSCCEFFGEPCRTPPRPDRPRFWPFGRSRRAAEAESGCSCRPQP